ncbi:30S ribosomal protein S9 [Candidatus Microgenomates bacterium]|nr:30S ribosomal protein S9 [Candidatus Microgenomates bacterium]
MVRKKTEKTEVAKEVKPEKKEYILTVGRRREAIARVRLYSSGSGKITVNEKPVEQYFYGQTRQIAYGMPFAVTDTAGKFDVTAKVTGGGMSGQLGALVHGMARALEKKDKEKWRPLLKKAGLLTRDPRAKERRKPGLAQKARAKKQSPKR